MPQMICSTCVVPLIENPAQGAFHCPRCQTTFHLDQLPAVSWPTEEPPLIATSPAADRQPAKSNMPLLIGCLSVVFLFGVAASIGIGYVLTGARNEGMVAGQPERRTEPVVAGRSERVPEQHRESEQPAEVAPNRPIRVSADVLYLDSDYNQDLVAADLRHLDKIVEVSGVVGKVDKDEQGRYFVGACENRLILTEERRPRVMGIQEAARRLQEAALNSKYLPGVILHLRVSEAKRFVGLGGATSFTVRGRCKGSLKDPTTDPDRFVIVEDCVLFDKQ